MSLTTALSKVCVWEKPSVRAFQQEEKSLFFPNFLILGLNLYRGLRGGGSCGWDLEDVVNWKAAF